MTNTAEILKLFDTHVRGWTGEITADFRFEKDGPVVRMVGNSLEAHSNAVLLTDLNSSNAEAIIAREIAFFGAQGRSFEWKHYSHDTPAELPDLLTKAGFLPEAQEVFVAFDTEQKIESPALPAEVEIRALTDAASIQNAITWVNVAVYGDAAYAAWLANTIAAEKQANPDGLSLYAAYADEEPVSIAWMRHQRGDLFGGLFGGSTVEGWRGKGIYSTLVAMRAAEAKERGGRWLTVDCSPMSLPILERRGFQRLSVITPFIWAPPKES
ncbi:GNAT family N-acetyltransferase [Microvirga flavescens]|uniref:GNAT family N-acetyltransferase n=1 Tax=Microvirga flavescens TaxID=2249811 RepID=UPI000DD8CA11|nr:GNAT family N-acetyltransferase [Microvirga flavescens]